MTDAIKVEDLVVEFPQGFRRAPFCALRGMDLVVARGEIVGILGPNGSGKTTLLRTLGGLQRPTRGRVTILGKTPIDPALGRLVGYQPEGPLPFPRLSGAEYLDYVGALMRMPSRQAREEAQRWLATLGLGDAGSKAVRHYSTGMRRRLALAAALLADPEVLLLDEPTSGLDPEGSLMVMDILREKAHAGRAVLLASHHLQEVEQTCDRVYLLHDGEVAREGTLDGLLSTGEARIVVRGLDEPGLQGIEAAIRAAGGEVVRRDEAREHLFALFRRLREEGRP